MYTHQYERERAAKIQDAEHDLIAMREPRRSPFPLYVDEHEHPVRQVIMGIAINAPADERDAEQYHLGHNGVTRIEACTKSGSMASVPYVRVWKGDVAYAEFCQHNIVGVYFGEQETAPESTRTAR